jgi:tetratricopeptide (TPR) repeat protein
LKEPMLQSTCFGNLAIHMRNKGDLQKCEVLYERALELCGDEPSINRARSLTGYASCAAARHEYGVSLERLEVAERVALSVDDQMSLAGISYTRGLCYLGMGDSTCAATHIAESISLCRRCGDVQGILGAIERAAIISLRQAQYARAAQLLGGCAAFFLRLGISRAKDLAKEHEAAVIETVEALGPEAAAHHMAVGSKMRIDELAELGGES